MLTLNAFLPPRFGENFKNRKNFINDVIEDPRYEDLTIDSYVLEEYRPYTTVRVDNATTFINHCVERYGWTLCHVPYSNLLIKDGEFILVIQTVEGTKQLAGYA